MLITKLVSLMLLSTVSGNVEEETGGSCMNVNTIQRVPSTASGRWYLVAAKGREMILDKTNNMQLKMTQCGEFNEAIPCPCTFFDVGSTLPEPFISEYNITKSTYNITAHDYGSQTYAIKLADNSSDLAMFKLGSQDGSGTNLIIHSLATDNHKTYMLLYICNNSGDEMGVRFLSKSPIPSEESITQVSKALENNKLKMSDLLQVSQENCVYPLMSVAKANPDKFRIF